MPPHRCWRQPNRPKFPPSFPIVPSTLFYGHCRAIIFKPLLSSPGFSHFADEVAYWTASRGNFSLKDFYLVKATERIGDRPILFVSVAGDRRMPPSVAQELYAHAQSPLKKIIVLPGHRHGEGFNQATEPYEKAVTDFLLEPPHW